MESIGIQLSEPPVYQGIMLLGREGWVHREGERMSVGRRGSDRVLPEESGARMLSWLDAQFTPVSGPCKALTWVVHDL